LVPDYSPASIRVIVPVGGRAKRLLPLTAEVSKACVRLLNRPLIEIALACLARQGIRNFIFGVKGYVNFKSLHDYFGSGVGFSRKYNIKPRAHIKYSPNVEDYGSADSVRINLEYYDIKDPIFGVQGDNIFDIDLEDLVDFHVRKEAFLTIGLREVDDVTGFGIAETDKDMRIARFIEKPEPEEAPSNLANTGIYLFGPEIREIFNQPGIKKILKERRRLDFGYDLIPYLLDSGYQVYGYVLKGNWYDVGTPSRYLHAMKEILHGGLESLRRFGHRVSKNAWIQGTSVESVKRREKIVRKIQKDRIVLEGAVLIGRHCHIGDNVRIVDSCIDNYTKIGDNVTVIGSSIMDRVIIGDGAEIRDSIIGRHTSVNSQLNAKTKINDTSVISDDVVLEAGSTLVNTKVYPHLKVPRGEYINQTIKQVPP